MVVNRQIIQFGMMLRLVQEGVRDLAILRINCYDDKVSNGIAANKKRS